MASIDNIPRGFKGIWIPREIWLHKELTCFEKSLWAEIHSLDDDEKGCTASNEYLCNFFNIQEKTLQRGLAKLKNLGYIKVEKFNGRIRVLRASIKDIFDTSAPTSSSVKDIFDTPEGTILTPLTIEPYNKVDNKDNTNPLPLSKGEDEFLFFGTYVKIKKKEHAQLLIDYGESLIHEVCEQINDHIASVGKKPYKDYAATIRNWIRRRGIQPSKAKEENQPPGSAAPPSFKNNKDWAIHVKNKFNNISGLEIGNEGISFSFGQSYVLIKFNDHGFREQVLSKLRKMNLSVDGV